MGDIQTRPFSKNYSGLINQTVIGIGITVLCVGGHELMKRRRRGNALKDPPPGLGSRESWEFGYLYQGRSWARFPSPPTPVGWVLSWVPQAIKFPEEKFNELRGVDASFYVRFLRGCFWFALLHSLTTFPILFPIHVRFSDPSIDPKSMTRASISSLVRTEKGLSLLWIHICLLFWVTLSWMATLFWIINGTFRLRAFHIVRTAKRSAELAENPHLQAEEEYYQHPHPQYAFKDIPSKERDKPERGIRHRTVMVSNIPHALRTEKDLQEYFEYYMSRKVEKPSMGLTSSTQPGFLNKSFAFLFNRAKKLPAHLPTKPLIGRNHTHANHRRTDSQQSQNPDPDKPGPRRRPQVSDIPLIERVVVARKMTELASLLERREEILVNLETAHIKLANKALTAVKTAMERRDANKPIITAGSDAKKPINKAAEIAKQRRSLAVNVDAAERGEAQGLGLGLKRWSRAETVQDPERSVEEEALDEEERMEALIRVLGPYVEEFGTQRPLGTRSKKAISRTSRQAFKKLRNLPGSEEDEDEESATGKGGNGNEYQLSPATTKDRISRHRQSQYQSQQEQTIWDTLLSLPRSSLDAYQPLVNLSHLFHGQTVPSIDYYTAKLNLLTSLITENRAKLITDYDPVSTAFVTFADPADARRACKYLAVHPNNPMACLVTMAPEYQDIDWIRIMKSSYKGEFVKDWVVNLGVWGFTIFWLFPVSLLVGLVSIQNISLFWPSLKRYLEHHPWQSEVLQSFIPTLLVASLALLIPLVLLLIAKKAHTITTLSALHDLIMTRYYKFLIVNVLIFFCIGTLALQSFLLSFRKVTSPDIINVVADSFPTAGPFYVGWLIFTTAMHGGFELALLGLPLIVYPTTKRQVTPRKRAVGVRPRTLNFYYWLPNHTLVIHVIFLFSILNPFVLPFGALYFFVQSGVIKNQLLHVHAKHYEQDGRVLMIRVLRYSLDGLVLSQAVFLGYMVVLKRTIIVGFAGFLIVFTVLTKLLMTRMVRAQLEKDDIAQAEALCNVRREPDSPTQTQANGEDTDSSDHHDSHEDPHSLIKRGDRPSGMLTWKLPAWVNFSYHSGNQRAQKPQRRPPNPFGPNFGQDSIQYQHLRTGSAEEKTDVRVDASNGDANDAVRSPRRKARAAGVLNVDLGPTPPSNATSPHPPPKPWDDQDLLDLPYDNPFYTRMIDNALWLPRDPTGVLNLDDTIDLKIAITVEESAGRLGNWLGVGETSSPEELSLFSKSELTLGASDRPPNSPYARDHTALPLVDGTEEIELPPTIAKRVKAKEPDIEQTLRSKKSGIFTSRKVSGSADRLNPSVLSVAPVRKPSVLFLEAPGSPGAAHRSLSDGPRPTTAGSSAASIGMGRRRARSGSIFSTLGLPTSNPVERNHSDLEFGVRPDTHAQAEFIAANTSGSRLSLAPPKLAKSSNVSASQAIYHEVLEEERQALRDRLEAENAEAEEAMQHNSGNKSWWTSWLFTRPPPQSSSDTNSPTELPGPSQPPSSTA